VLIAFQTAWIGWRNRQTVTKLYRAIQSRRSLQVVNYIRGACRGYD